MKDKKNVIEKLREEVMEYAEKQRKNAFPAPAQAVDDTPERDGEKKREKPQK